MDKPIRRSEIDANQLEIWQQRWRAASPASIPERCLKSDQVAFYGVVVTEQEHGYPYFSPDSSVPVGFKVRKLEHKDFTVVGKVGEAGLFGQQKYGNHERKRVVVTEGELDALAVRQMMGGGSAWSRSRWRWLNGKGSRRTTSSSMGSMRYSCFDADERSPGGGEGGRGIRRQAAGHEARLSDG